VPRHKAHIIAQREELFAYGRQKRRMVAAREIGSADRSLEQHVADKREPRLRLKKHHMARGMAGAMQDVETHAAHVDLVAVTQPLIGGKRYRGWKPEQFCLLRQDIEPELLFALRADDGDAERIAQFRRGADVVEMAVGQQNALQRKAALRYFGQQAFGLAAGVDQRGATRFVPDQRAVLLIRSDGENGKFHTPHYLSNPPRHAMPAPDALLLISTHCPHCPAMLSALADLVKQGMIGRLEAVNLEQHPEVGQTLGVRSVPWVRIGRIELAGVHSPTELADWAAKADSAPGVADYFHLLLKEGQLPKVQAMIEADPALLAAVLPIVGNVEASLNVRLGAGVLLENFAGTDALRALLPRLGELSQHEDTRVRADACYYLGLSGDSAARPWLDPRLTDEDADVREIAAESLQAISN
jgi:thiol-disulfide isomerase/thioredoxin